MTDWRTRLREADPDRRAPAPDVGRVRARVLLEAARPAPRQRGPVRPLAFVMTMSTIVAAAVGLAYQGGVRKTAAPASADRLFDARAPRSAAGIDQGEEVERQQLQFSLPGGTRIIWVFDSTFEVKGTLP